VRVAVLSDIHGNIDGLDACLNDLDAQGGADHVVAAGDLCMDGPFPDRVIARLRERNARCVRGNTDREIATADLATLDDDEASMIRWQRERLGHENVAWLRALPFSLSFGDGPDALLVVHANPHSDDEHVWPDADEPTLERFFASVIERTIAFGHLHLPYVRVWRDKTLVDVASAGLPKDGDPRAHYVIFTQRSGGWEVKSRRVAFDVERVAAAIVSEAMPGSRRLVTVLRRHRYKQIGNVIP